MPKKKSYNNQENNLFNRKKNSYGLCSNKRQVRLEPLIQIHAEQIANRYCKRLDARIFLLKVQHQL